jgi:hypothetical protein
MKENTYSKFFFQLDTFTQGPNYIVVEILVASEIETFKLIKGF